MAIKQSEILGLFTSPQDIQALERQRISEESAMYQDPIARQMYMSTAGLARGLGGAFGAQPAGTQEAAMVEKIRKEVPFDANKQSEYYTTLGQRLINQGLTKAGIQALELAKKARLDEAKIKKDTSGELGSADKKAIREATTSAAKAKGMAMTAKGLRDKFLQKKPSSGVMGFFADTWKEFVGSQDEVTLLKKRYKELKNSIAMNNLPPGAASDADVALALGGFPSENTKAETLANYLDGLYKASVVQQEFNNFYAKYLSDNSGDSSGVEDAWQKKAETIDWEGQYGIVWSTDLSPQDMPSVGQQGSSGTTDWSSL